MDVVVAVRDGICADVAQFCVGRAVIRYVGAPNRMQNSMPAGWQLLFPGLQG